MQYLCFAAFSWASVEVAASSDLLCNNSRTQCEHCSFWIAKIRAGKLKDERLVSHTDMDKTMLQ